MENIRYWFIQKHKECNITSMDSAVCFQEFTPTIAKNGFEWIKVISLDDFHKEAGINITKYISMAKELKKLQSELEKAEKVIEFYDSKTNRESLAINIESWIEVGGKKAREYFRKKELENEPR